MSRFAHRDLEPLVAHVELNRSDWFVAVLARWLLTELVRVDGALDNDAVRSLLPPELKYTRSQADVDTLMALLEKDELVSVTDGEVRVTQRGIATVDRSAEASERLDELIEERFMGLLNASFGALPHGDLWVEFRDDVLFPIIRNLGVQSRDILQKNRLTVLDDTRLQNLAASWDIELPSLRSAVATFLDPGSPEVRRYIYGQSAIAMFELSVSLPPATVLAMSMPSGATPTFDFYIDTNVLFSMLGIHDNPSNEAATRLLELRETLSDDVVMKLFMLGKTHQEARHSLDGAANFWRGLSVPSIVAEAALSSQYITGLNKAYLERAAKGTQPVDAVRYFESLRDRFQLLVSDKGVVRAGGPEEMEWAEPSGAEYVKRLDRFVYPQVNRAGIRTKPMGSLRHDYVLREYVRRLRDTAAATFLEARYWVVTADKQYIVGDEVMALGDHEMPCVIHVQNLLHLLQLWAPRSDQLEAALVAAVRHPLLFVPYEAAAEAVTLSVVQRLSEYHDMNSVSVDTVAAVITDEAVRSIAMQVLSGESEEATLTSTIESQLVTRLAEVESERDESEREHRRVQEKLASFESEGVAGSGESRPSKGRSRKKKRAHESRNKQRADVEGLRAELAEQKKEAADHERMAAEARSQAEGFRVIAQVVVPVGLAAFVLLVALAGVLRVSADWTLPQIALVVLPGFVLSVSLCIRVGPWPSDSTWVRLMAHWVPIAIFAVVWGVAASLAIAAFSLLE